MLSTAFNWWWRYVGPSSGFLGGVLFVCSLLLAAAIICPPLFWALKMVFSPVLDLIEKWWQFWLPTRV